MVIRAGLSRPSSWARSRSPAQQTKTYRGKAPQTVEGMLWEYRFGDTASRVFQ